MSYAHRIKIGKRGGVYILIALFSLSHERPNVMGRPRLQKRATFRLFDW